MSESDSDSVDLVADQCIAFALETAYVEFGSRLLEGGILTVRDTSTLVDPPLNVHLFACISPTLEFSIELCIEACNDAHHIFFELPGALDPPRIQYPSPYRDKDPQSPWAQAERMLVSKLFGSLSHGAMYCASGSRVYRGVLLHVLHLVAFLSPGVSLTNDSVASAVTTLHKLTGLYVWVG